MVSLPPFPTSTMAASPLTALPARTASGYIVDATSPVVLQPASAQAATMTNTQTRKTEARQLIAARRHHPRATDSASIMSDLVNFSRKEGSAGDIIQPP